MPRPACVPCQVFMVPTRNDYCIEGDGALWFGDLWRCPACGHEIVTGYAKRPLAEHWQPHFAPLRDAERALCVTEHRR